MAFERASGRKVNEPRAMEAKAGVIKNADGSAMFKMGDTIAYAAVYGPRDLYPKFMQNPKKGILRCNYNMMPFSGSGERVRPGQNRRAKEISMVTEKALLPVLELEDFPNAVVDVYVELPQTDAGSRCAGICAAAIALADAGLVMKDMIAAVSVGNLDGNIVVDLDKDEEDFEGPVADIPVAIIPSTGQITLLQMDGEITPEKLVKALELAQETCMRINEVQRKALKDKYAGE
ncbi:exosome complex exonuclease Rrp41 [Candidatus Woesearchaeota archaeon]|nr:exosome complex exonuclease Rrp41 [Candidatus Woesearchaeota archaeon]